MLGARIPHVSVHGGGLGDHSWRSNLISRSMADIQQTFSISSTSLDLEFFSYKFTNVLQFLLFLASLNRARTFLSLTLET
jgi:hypothetical protein